MPKVMTMFKANLNLFRGTWRLLVLPTLIAALFAMGLAPRAASGQQVTPEQVDAAIERAVKYLISQQSDNGQWSGHDYTKPLPDSVKYPGQNEVVAMAALAYVDGAMKMPEVEAGFQALIKIPLEQTYTLGFRMIAVAEFYRNAKDERQRTIMRASLRQDAMTLLSIQRPNGAWFYAKATNPLQWCFSNTQVAILALQQAASCGVEMPAEPFHKVQELYLEKQRSDGGWNYGRPGAWERAASYGSMTAAATASLLLTRDMLNPGGGCPCRGGASRAARDPRVDEAINKGIGWLGREFRANTNPHKGSGIPYWLYAAERVGIASGIKYFGTRDWYAQGAAQLLRTQQSDGSWASLSDTMFAILFLVKGQGPILLNKLMYDGPWDINPYDAANLARYVGELKEQRFNWQAIHMDLPVEDWHDAPILYISTERAIELSTEQKLKLRQFTDSGGTILAEASCGNRVVQRWWVELFKEIWPEYELSRLPREHPVWTADIQITGRMPALMTLDDGLRTFVFYSTTDISCFLHLNQRMPNKTLFDLGNNLYAYTTDRGKLRTRLSGRHVEGREQYADQQVAAGGIRASLNVVHLKHDGDWYIGRNYNPWQALASRVQTQLNLPVKMADNAVAAGDGLDNAVDIVYISGRRSFGLAGDGASQLKQFTAAGGLIIAEAVLGGSDFDAAFRAAMTKAGYVLRDLSEVHSLVAGNFEQGKGYDVSRVGFTHKLRAERIGRPQPVLSGIFDGDRMVGVYSPFDLMYAQTGAKAFDSRGYLTADAEAIAANLIIWASGQPRP